MRVKDSYILKKVSDSWVVLPLGGTKSTFNGMIMLNETGAYLWNILKVGTDREGLITALTSQYDVDSNQAAADVDSFLAAIRPADCLEE